ncbi:MAG: hypothetical protein V7K38_15310 [Nostoc sp.]|uniref:hypothetical protein n=1 Tax=Nostoc sp. TaxID=1180 RepID=UPI002FF9327A
MGGSADLKHLPWFPHERLASLGMIIFSFLPHFLIRYSARAKRPATANNTDEEHWSLVKDK